MAPRHPVALAALVSLLVLSLAPAAQGRTVRPSKDLWATVNICDTPAHPDTIGIRGSMPGSGRRGEVMFMRFRVQFYARTDQKWHNIARGADSGLIRVGSARHKVRQSGWSFRFMAPDGSDSYVVRGVVTFAWRRERRINGRRTYRTVARTERRTKSGHPNAVGADPPGYSSGLCEIR